MSSPLLLGIEIGGTKLQLGLGRGDGEILELVRLEVIPGSDASGIRQQLVKTIGPLLAKTGQTKIRAAGIGFGGPVDADRGCVTVSHQVAGWSGFPIVDWFREQLGIDQIALQNDADTAALGEARFGAGVGISPLLYVNNGSGIGGGLIVDGQIYRGIGRGAVEIGHLWIEPPEADQPGASLESIASGWSIARAASERWAAQKGSKAHHKSPTLPHLPMASQAEMVFEAALKGDPEARAVLDRATNAMALGLAHAITLLAPRRLVLGGGVSLAPATLWIDPIRERLDRLVFPPFRGTFDVVVAKLGESVVVQGALALAKDLCESR